ncbi:ABC transporter substrate-binding protein [Nocardia wallacei]|uniref:ABC transporter substrate-binding protein n=1 Tax=Nocardia wallacei TaxID=480035 RepID=UPI0024567D4C|nr:ABC transporter substrate-binding protein [Nocardia wallacei]
MRSGRKAERRNRRGAVRKSIERIGFAAVALTLAVTVAGCGSDSDSGASGSGDGGAVTIKHRLGETTVEGTPQRVVTIGNQWLDAALALQVTPVGYVDMVAAGTNTKAPWEPESLGDAKQLSPSGNMVEQIAALNPDLILVPSYGVDKSSYDQLSKLAPTIGAVSEGVQVDLWTDDVTTLGKVLHKQEQADKVIADVNGRIDELAKKYPGLRGKTYLTTMLTGPAQLMVLADPKDGSAKLFEQLGLRIPDRFVQEAGKAGGRLALSPERLADLTSDLLVASAMPGMEENFKGLPGYAQLPSVRSNGLAFVDAATINAINTPTALSVPFVLGKLEPALANVAK